MHKSEKPMFRIWSFFLMLCVAASAGAQTGIPDPADELQRQDRQRQELRKRLEAQPWQRSDPAQPSLPPQRIADEQPCARIERVFIEGVLSGPALQQALKGVGRNDPPEGRCLGDQGITVLIQRLQQSLVEQGYLTSHVNVPEQDINNGILRFRILEGRIDQIRGASETTVLPRLAWAMQPGDILNLRDIEQSAENLQRLTSLRSSLRIQPGATPGASDLVMETQAGRPLRLSLSLDDSGHKTTGKVQGNATLGWDNPLGLADFFYVSAGQELGGRDTGPRGSRNTMLHYSLPWGYWMLAFTVSRNQYHETGYGPYESYLYRGTSGQQEVALTRVLHRDRDSKTSASLKGFLRRSNNYIADLEVLVQRRRTAGWEATLHHQHQFAHSRFSGQLMFRQGTGAFDALAAPESWTGQGSARMRLMTGTLHWTASLNAHGHPWQYSTQLQAQWAGTRLTPQDRLCLGGRGMVRGFDGQQTLCGDHGQLWRQELATALPAAPSWAQGVQMFAALDAGRVSTPSHDHADHLAGVAWGLRGQYRILAEHPLHWEVFVSRPVSQPPGFSPGRYSAGFHLRAEF